MRNIIVYLLLVIFLSGCSRLNALIKYSNEQDALQRYVEKQAKQIEQLFADIDDGKLIVGKTTKRQVKRLYGDPILVKKIDINERLLYRKEMEYFPSQKVYLTFDANGVLADIEIVVSKNTQTN